MTARLARRLAALAALAVLLALGLGPAAVTAPTSVTLAGDFQSELGCPGDWDPACTATDLAATDGLFAGAFTIPAGSYQYKAALDHGWNESYGLNGGSANIPLAAPGGRVAFVFDPAAHRVYDSVNGVIVTAPGNYQHAVGCGDWSPGCLKTLLTDPDGDGVFTWQTRAIPPGVYEAKAALALSWDVNYGAGGVQDGPNISFSVTAPNQRVLFTFDSHTHVLTIQAGHAHDGNVEWNGLAYDSRETLYKVPQGAVPAGTPTTIRF